MRKIYLTAFIVGLSFALASPIYAQDEEQDPDRVVDTEIGRIHHKLKRGAINVVTFPLEIPKHTKEVIDEGGDNTVKRAALIVPGLIKGVGYSVIRLVSGAWDVLTFTQEFPKDHEPMLKPNYVWEEEEK